MTKFFSSKSTLVLGMVASLALSGALGTRAAAQMADTAPTTPVAVAPALTAADSGAVQPANLSAQATAPDRSDTIASPDTALPADHPVSLEAMVARQPVGDALSGEMRCLATAVYFESAHEVLAGQLAVGRVIVARSKSGRFPASYCGVVTQHSQFSFVHNGALPKPPAGSLAWHHAVAIAKIAASGSWKSPVEGALYFHAARVSPHWHLHRLAQIDNHIFYR